MRSRPATGGSSSPSSSVSLLLHQSDKLLIGTLTPDIMDDFQFSKAQMGAGCRRGALLVGAILLSLLGATYTIATERAKLLALASFSGAPPLAQCPRADVPQLPRDPRIDRDRRFQLPRLYSLISDLFRSQRCAARSTACWRSRLPLGFLSGDGVGGVSSPSLPSAGAECVIYITGSLGILLSLVTFFGSRMRRRGASAEPKCGASSRSGNTVSVGRSPGTYSGSAAWCLLFTQGFFGVLPVERDHLLVLHLLEENALFGQHRWMITMGVGRSWCWRWATRWAAPSGDAMLHAHASRQADRRPRSACWRAQSDDDHVAGCRWVARAVHG